MNETIELDQKNLKKLKETELEILIELDRICKKHNIKYSLTGGTLLGAIRHNGFIPWDDDIDIDMTRKDYNKFREIQKTELDSKRFYLDCIETKENCGMLYAKLKRKDSIYIESSSNRDEKEQNIWIDIFPIDNISNNKLIRKYLIYKVYCLKIILMYKYGYIKNHNNKTIFKLVKISCK